MGFELPNAITGTIYGRPNGPTKGLPISMCYVTSVDTINTKSIHCMCINSVFMCLRMLQGVHGMKHRNEHIVWMGLASY